MKLFQKIIFCFALLMAVTVHAQPLFVVDHNKVCLGTVINITDFSSGGIGSINYDYGDGTSSVQHVSNDTSHLYLSTSPVGGFKLKQFFNTSSGAVSYTLPITVVPTTTITASSKLCANGEVVIYITDTRFDSYDIDFGDGSGVVNAPSDPSGVTTSIHTYGSISTFNVSIKGKFNTGNYCAAADVVLSVTPITTVPAPNVTFLETTVEDQINGTITVNFINTSAFDYRLDFKRNGFSYYQIDTVKSTSGLTSYTFNKTNTNPYNPVTQAALYAGYTLNTKQVAYCVKVSSLTACGSSALFDEICSITQFTAIASSTVDLEDDLTWEAYAGPNINAIEVDRNNAAIATLGGAAVSYNDNTGLQCATAYDYQLKGILTTTSTLGPQYSLSAHHSVTATSVTPRPALTNVNSTISGTDITVTFAAVGGGFTAKSYTLFESVNGGSFNQAASNNGSATSFTLHERKTSGTTYCYQVTYTDLCNLSPPNGSAMTTCPIDLTVSLASDGSVAINWTPYAGSTPTTSYTVEVKDAQGNVIKTIPGGLGTTATDLLTSSGGSLFYDVVSDAGSVSALVELVLSPAVYVPNAFSPNGDGINDLFEIKGRFIQSIDVAVFNRWGEPVFHSTDPKVEWDGKVNGADALIGTYAYTIEVTGQKGETIKKRGTVSLVR